MWFQSEHRVVSVVSIVSQKTSLVVKVSSKKGVCVVLVDT